MRIATLTGVLLLCLTAAACHQATVTSQKDDAVTALADHIAIENLAARYVSHLGGQAPEAFGDFYTDDAVFDVNGAVYSGKKAIVDLYSGMRNGRPADAAPDANGVSHMVLTNPVIEIKGDTATASFIWTGIHSPKDPTEVPTITEQGREYALYARQPDGRWLIKKRTVIADGAVPKGMLNTWKRRLDNDITK